MNVVIVEMRKPNGKLARTFRETFIGGLIGGRDAMKAKALAIIVRRCSPLFPGHTFSVRNSNM